MNSVKKKTGSLEDIKINVRIKLAALWATVMFCYIYGDVFSLFVPGRLQNLMNGKMELGVTTPGKLLLSSIVVTVPALMVFLSLVLNPKLNRWTNISLGLIYTLMMLAIMLASISPWMAFYVFLAIVEIIITSTIVWQAFKWPRNEM